MPKINYLFSQIFLQMSLMGILAMSGLVFVPLLLRSVDAEIMATVLVAQVCVHYLVVFVQYGFVLSGPAKLAMLVDEVDRAILWRNSVHGKLLLLIGSLSLIFGLSLILLISDYAYLFSFCLLLLAAAFNSNWWLQAHQRFAPAVVSSLMGVVLSLLVIYALDAGCTCLEIASQGAWIVLVLVLPQVCVGFGTWWVSRNIYFNVLATFDNNVRRWTPLDSRATSMSWLRVDAPLVASQLMLLGATSLGTVVVGALADTDTAAAYAAIEKLFNLAATVFVNFYIVYYAKLVQRYYTNRLLYWQAILRLLIVCLCFACVLAALLVFMGPSLLGWYLPEHMLPLVAPVMGPFGLWLGLCVIQHVLTTHFVLIGHKHMVLLANACVMLSTVVVGYVCSITTPVAWVYGMVAGQVLALMWLLRIRSHDRALCI